MTTPTTSQIESACDSCEDVSWYGYYNGRWGFKGYAIVVSSAAGLTELMINLDRQGLKMPMPDHNDNMGLDRLFAWSEDVFSSPKPKTSYEFRTLNAG